MTPLFLRRLAHAAAGALAPGPGGRWATDVFSRTRALGTQPDNVLPLGARGFDILGNPDVHGGYLWGDDDRPTALLVHGWGADSSSMYSLIAPLRELGYRVAAFDAPAHGVHRGTQATMTQYTAAVRAALDSLGGAKVIVAHSLGSIAAVGAVAMEERPDVDCITLVAPTCTLTAVLERWSRGELMLSRAIVDRIYRELHRRNGVPVSHWDVVGLGRELDIPVLALHDPGDPVVPYCEAEAIAAGLKDVRLQQAPGRGHMGILMSPEVKSAISAFVAEHGTRTGETIP
ncbi:alpha/beta fold hydrolase [Streptomyces roseoverticillatus]|uniref:alpha/beta fold hydrolase n=1 Tax=Streptomyces roseoverticillatus TaxID=66429 RepID=UPI0004BEF06D|nr:alpha/beta fold hydrolase [Streptomyces roseoverticillatus]